MNKRVVELFAGVGGFRLGLEKNGFEVVFGSQFEPGKKKQHAFDCYSTRFTTGIHSNQDIATVTSDDIPEHEVLVGGFPCQDYSVARTQANGLEGKKGVLFWEIERIVREKNPKFVLLENVDRLLKSPAKQRGRDFGIMLAAFNNLGYGIEWRVINAADYGFAQRRRRVFIFAYKLNTNYASDNDEFFDSKFPVELVKSESETVLHNDLVEMSEEFQYNFMNSGTMVKGKVHTYEIVPKTTPSLTLRDVLETEVDEKYYLSGDLEKWQYLKGAKKIERESATGHKYIFSEGALAFPDPLDRPARTMLTSESSKNRSTHVIEDPQTKRLRVLTPVECERLNGFPDNWTDSGMTEKFRYFTMGNALVVGLIEKMGKRLSDIIDNEK
ncbi:DNA (cytosine-5-)-methyltransferase [Fictibacillus nanhaiensis]|uniref:DNA (cytosine-5-)-methyltransferase n=1 Tax=Fictibacillus nanhaiensis TaxID=742169 RepID=UPI002E1B3CE9|nr:DNA (cytosine-5-)-methyltransferase [Fictibacillus nanhaiensis]